MVPRMHEISNILLSENDCLLFLLEKGILTSLSECPECCGSVSRYGKKWQCTKRSCQKSVSILRGKFFAGSRLKCNEVIHMAYLWLTGCSAKTIGMHTGHTEHTVSDYQRYFRQLVSEMLEDDDHVVGGNGIVVQVDETKMGKRKYHRGHRVDGAWVIVGVEMTEHRRVFAEVVQDRSESTIVGVLGRHIAKGSIVWTDKWKGYFNLSRIFSVQHETVNHTISFKDPLTGINTNTVEGTNYALKRAIPPRNRTESCLPDMLNEFVWRRKYSDSVWESFILGLKEVIY